MKLTWRLAGLSLIFVLVAEILMIFPALSYVRYQRLSEYIDDAALVADSLLSYPGVRIEPRRAELLLKNTNVLNIATIGEDVRNMILPAPRTIKISDTIDMRTLGLWDKLSTFKICPKGDMFVVRLIGQAKNGMVIDTTVDEVPICAEINNVASLLLVIAVSIALLVGLLLYAMANNLVVGPLLRVTRALMQFRGEKDEVEYAPQSHVREILLAERSLVKMQKRIQDAIAQKERLANLGLSVSKIQHDLRNMLATAQMISEGLQDSKDPKVRNLVPRLERSLDRAIALASGTLEYGRLDKAHVRLAPVGLVDLVSEILEEKKSTIEESGIILQTNLDKLDRADFVLKTDVDHVHRIVDNILRNAIDVLKEHGKNEKHIGIDLEKHAKKRVVTISDNGPGLPQEISDNLFKPFVETSKKQGTGLGLAISSELASLVGGRLSLRETGAEGTIFSLELPKI